MMAMVLLHREYIVTNSPEFEDLMQFFLILEGLFPQELLIDTDIIFNSFITHADKTALTTVLK